MIDLKSKTQAQENLLRRIKSRNWLESTLKEVQEKYAENWIAIAGEEIVAFGTDPEEVKEKARSQFSASEVILVKVPTGEISRPA
jgi:agmatine/peptidylarginine deiminase